MSNQPHVDDIDPTESREWLEALEAVVREDGPERARFLLERLLDHGRDLGAKVPSVAPTPFVNTIPTAQEVPYPGDKALEARIESVLRWNAMAMVARANHADPSLGGHISTYQSIATLYEVGFHHFWRAPNEEHGGDLVFIQGHGSPGIYARALLEGRVSVEELERFRREVKGDGLPSYPHPWLKPDFWQFATVSMGLGPLSAIYQARFMRYLHHRGLMSTVDRRVWAFLGDGEMDEPESLGALTVAGREGLDNLTFVVNCNLQRLDGPVRGNGKIIQELEGIFRGAGWNVIKVVWGADWDPIFARDEAGLLRRRLDEVVDGDLQAYAYEGRSGAYMREHLFGTSPALEKLVEDLSEEELSHLRRGGHDRAKIYNAYSAAVRHRGAPTVILALTIKGYGLGAAGEAKNVAHQVHEISEEDLKAFRDRFNVPVVEGEIAHTPFIVLEEDSPEVRYLRGHREKLGGFLPQRRAEATKLEVPDLEAFKTLTQSGDASRSTTAAFGFALRALLRDDKLRDHIVPIIPDEARTFGLENLMLDKKQAIYMPGGQRYEPREKYVEKEDGLFLQEGISEAGAIASWTAAGTAYSNHGRPMVPFYIFYSMFGFQRIGDFIWAAADMRARGFLLGATSGRTTLNGEGLQHEDGHSHLIAATVPNCLAYDPTYGYELAVIIQDGLRRMLAEGESVFYYITVLNERYPQPDLPEGVEEGIRRGMYLLRESSKRGRKKRVQLLGCGAILQEVLAGAALLEDDFGVAADVWSVPSFTELRRNGMATERWNLLHPEAEPRTSYMHDCLTERAGPVVATTDYMRAFADQIRPYVPRRYVVLGTDGFGRSDSRDKLRWFFEVDRHYVVVAALKALAEEGVVPKSQVSKALKDYDLDPEKPDPTTI